MEDEDLTQNVDNEFFKYHVSFITCVKRIHNSYFHISVSVVHCDIRFIKNGTLISKEY